MRLGPPPAIEGNEALSAVSFWEQAYRSVRWYLANPIASGTSAHSASTTRLNQVVPYTVGNGKRRYPPGREEERLEKRRQL